MLRKGFRVMWLLLGLVSLAVLFLFWSAGERPGAVVKGDRLKRAQTSPQWNPRRGRFSNQLSEFRGSFFEMTGKYFFGGSKHRNPAVELPIIEVEPAIFEMPPKSGLRITWLGHSTYIVELEGLRVLIDPVWGHRASPFTWAGPKRFYRPPLPLNSLPTIDVILVSHDHYDHLDYETVQALKTRPVKWLVPLGVGTHLEKWGVAPDKIDELDWWESRVIKGVELTATPARHFSGRSLLFLNQNTTLWASWALNGVKRALFYSGDTGLHPEFKTIGETLGPFDVTLIETGAYNAMWPDVHLGPEQAVLAHTLVRGAVMIPAHWGLFDLALHGWTEPAERVIEAAKELSVAIHIGRPGSSYDVDAQPTVDRFWPDIAWTGMAEEPTWSTEVRSLQAPFRGSNSAAPKP